jgi:anti-anti-sigma factor
LSIGTRTLSQREILLTLTGELDYASAQHLRAAITAALTGKADTIIVSLAGVTFVDSTGIGTLVVARRICNDMRATLRVSDANPFITRLFDVVGVSEALGLPPTSSLAPHPSRLGSPARLIPVDPPGHRSAGAAPRSGHAPATTDGDDRR